MSLVFYTSVAGPDHGFVQDVSHLKGAGFDFVCIHDRFVEPPAGWQCLSLEQHYPFDDDNPGLRHRWLKTQPRVLLSDYEYSVYLDPKWEFDEEFLTLCKHWIDIGQDWMVCPHPSRRSLFEEFLFPFANGTLSLAECERVVDVLEQQGKRFDQFFPSLTTWMIRRHNRRNQDIGKRWFELMQNCYRGYIRDQILLPFAVSDASQIQRCLSLQEFYDAGVTLNYPNQNRVREWDWREPAGALLEMLQKRTGLSIQQQMPELAALKNKRLGSGSPEDTVL